jgi:hypothetical protein
MMMLRYAMIGGLGRALDDRFDHWMLRICANQSLVSQQRLHASQKKKKK